MSTHHIDDARQHEDNFTPCVVGAVVLAVLSAVNPTAAQSPPPGSDGVWIGWGWLRYLKTADFIEACKAAQNLRIGVWNVTDGRSLRTIPVDFEQVTIFGLSATGRTAVLREEWHHMPSPPGMAAERSLVGMAGSIVLLNLDDGQRLLTTGTRAVIAGSRLVVREADDKLHVYDIDTGRTERVIAGWSDPLLAAGDVVPVVEPLDDYRQREYTVSLWNLSNGRKVASITAPEGYGSPRAISPNGRYLVFGGHYQAIVVDSATGGTLLHVDPPTRRERGSGLRVLHGQIQHIAFSTDSRRVAFTMGRFLGIADLSRLGKATDGN